VIDGEVVALDEQGKPNFDPLQNYRSAESHIILYAFDVLVRRGENLARQALSKRRGNGSKGTSRNHSVHLHIQIIHSKNGYCKFLKQQPFGVLVSAQYDFSKRLALESPRRNDKGCDFCCL
jgi:hypothetical protein